MSAISYITFDTFHDRVKAEVSPEGLAENLITPFRNWVGVGLSEVQVWIHWYREFNARFITKSDVTEFCGTSIFQGPRGKITQLFAYRSGTDCRRFHYKRVSQAEVDCWMDRQRCLCPASDPPETEIYLSPYCNYVIPGEDACAIPYLTGEEDDCRFTHLDDDCRIFAVGPDYRVYAAPRFPCNYILLLQWQGINKAWADGDVVHDDNQLQDAIVKYVEHRVFMKENQGKISGYYDAFVDSMRILRKRWEDEQNTPEERDCTSAIAQLTATLHSVYQTPIYGPGDSQAIWSESGQPLVIE